MHSRRRALALLCGGAAVSMPGWRAMAQLARLIPQRVSARVIVDNDFAGDPDGLVALAHQLLSPKTRTVLVTSSALNGKFVDKALAGRSAAAGDATAAELIGKMGLASAPPVVTGSESFGDGQGQVSAAARAIVSEAMRDDPLPLFVTCGGPLTNVAAALRLEPAIAKRMTLVWIGGGPYPEGGWEYNLATDVAAARRVIEGSDVALWQVPQNAYHQMQMSVAEMTTRLRTVSPLGQWLYERYTRLPSFVTLGGACDLGDSPMVLLTAISDESSRYENRTAQRIADDFRYGAMVPGRTIRVFESLDVRLAFEDLFALLQLQARAARGA